MNSLIKHTSLALSLVCVFFVSCQNTPIYTIDIITGKRSCIRLKSKENSPKENTLYREALLEVDAPKNEIVSITRDDEATQCFVITHDLKGNFISRKTISFYNFWGQPSHRSYLGDYFCYVDTEFDQLVKFDFHSQQKKVLMDSRQDGDASVILGTIQKLDEKTLILRVSKLYEKLIYKKNEGKYYGHDTLTIIDVENERVLANHTYNNESIVNYLPAIVDRERPGYFWICRLQAYGKKTIDEMTATELKNKDIIPIIKWGPKLILKYADGYIYDDICHENPDSDVRCIYKHQPQTGETTKICSLPKNDVIKTFFVYQDKIAVITMGLFDIWGYTPKKCLIFDRNTWQLLRSVKMHHNSGQIYHQSGMIYYETY